MPACVTRPRRAVRGREVGRRSRGRGCPAWPSACATGKHPGAGSASRAGTATARAGSTSPPAPRSGTIPACGWRSAGVGAVRRTVRDPSGEKEPQAFLCTDLAADPVDILRWLVRRWRTETTFEEARRHLGMETRRQWSDLAILRTTPAL